MLITNSAQIRAMDVAMTEEYAFPSLLLMESAGRQAAEIITKNYPRKHAVAVFCGNGNNGGDGMVIARHLHKIGYRVRIMFLNEPNVLKGDNLVNFNIIQKLGIVYAPYKEEFHPDIEKYLHNETLIVDALCGTGLRQKYQEPLTSLIKFLQQFNNEVVAIDLPSGLIADTGGLLNTPLKCKHTITFQLPKICHYVSPAADYCGTIHCVDIGIYKNLVDRMGIKTELVDNQMVRHWYKPRNPNSHKGDYGHILLVGGSRGKAGAIALAAKAAMDIGAGLCTALIPGSAMSAFHRKTLEGMSIPYGTDYQEYLDENAVELFTKNLVGKNVVAIGPGLGNNAQTATFFAKILPQIKVPLVLDADALNIIAEHPDLIKQLPLDTILTPHPGEMARLTKNTAEGIQEKRLESTTYFATNNRVIVVLKGFGTITADPKGNVYFNNSGTPGMATAGSGDVLTGAIAGLLAQKYIPIRAAAMGVYLHGKTGKKIAQKVGDVGITAGRLAGHLGKTLAGLIK